MAASFSSTSCAGVAQDQKERQAMRLILTLLVTMAVVLLLAQAAM